MLAAISSGDLSTVNKLINKKYRTAPPDDAIKSAVSHNQAEIVKILIDAGADIACGNHYPIIHAAQSGFVEVMQVLLAAGADPTVRDNGAIISAVSNNHPEIVKILIDAGADIAACDNYPIVYASQSGFVEVLKILLLVRILPHGIIFL
jgi:ankyrin repeat protein